jgi:hypothetical protein
VNFTVGVSRENEEGAALAFTAGVNASSIVEPVGVNVILPSPVRPTATETPAPSSSEPTA